MTVKVCAFICYICCIICAALNLHDQVIATSAGCIMLSIWDIKD
jgi:hypothetical protein